MTRYSVPFFCFTKNMARNTGKNISKNSSSKYSQERFDHAKNSATDALKGINNSDS